MQNVTVHPVSPALAVQVTRPMPPLSPALDARVEALWTRAADRVERGGAGRLFNGRVFSIDAITPDLITGHLTEYRRVVAQAEDHALFPDLGIRALAVCGVLRCAGGIVIGRRPAAAVYQPGLWQLCPAGSVDGGAARADGTMDYQAQLRTEIREEIGLPPETLGPATPLCVVEHPGSHVCDLGMAVTTDLGAEAVLAAHRDHGDGEYDPLRIVPVPGLPAFIDWTGDTLVPPAPVFLRRAGLLG
jgi:hypothetical protein